MTTDYSDERNDQRTPGAVDDNNQPSAAQTLALGLPDDEVPHRTLSADTSAEFESGHSQSNAASDHTQQSTGTPQEYALQEFLIPVHGFVRFTDRELEIIDHPAFQRLFNIHQLGQTHLVYRGATHRRGEHALGAVAAAQLLIEALERSPIESNQVHERWHTGRSLSPIEQALVRLCVLLHDIGHVVIGHTLEDELGLLEPHDCRARIEFVLDRRIWGGRTIDGLDCPISETLRERIDRLYKSEAVHATLKRPESDQSLTASELLIEIVTKDTDDSDRACSANPSLRLDVLANIVGNTVCADLIDYLHRDWNYIGRPRFLDTRLLHYMEIRCDTANTETGISESEEEPHIVVNLQSTKAGRYRSDAVTAIIDLLESRYQLWEIALLHRTKTGATAMLERGLLELISALGAFSDIAGAAERLELAADLQEHQQTLGRGLLEAVFEVSDAELYNVLSEDTWYRNLPGCRGLTVPPLSKDIFWCLRNRVLYKQVAHVGYGNHTKQVAERFAPSKADGLRAIDAAGRRLQSLRLLEEDFELKRGSLAMYCASPKLGQKFAEISVLYNDEVQPLKDLDASWQVSGGHLDAQIERFKHLWRASLFASSESLALLEQRDLLRALQKAFKIGVLGIASEDILMHDIAKMLAHSNSDISYASEERLVSVPLEAARGGSPLPKYPSGQATLRSYFSTDSHGYS